MRGLPFTMKRVAFAVLISCLASTVIPPAHARTITLDDLARMDGVAVLVRHAEAPGFSDPPNFTLSDCRTQRNLSPQGRQQARELGKAWRQAGVPVAEIRSSRWCRARDTARAMRLGDVVPDPNLDSLFLDDAPRSDPATRATRERISRHRGKPGVLVLVGHQVNIAALTNYAPSSAEAVVVRARPNGTLQVVGTLPAPAISS